VSCFSIVSSAIQRHRAHIASFPLAFKHYASFGSCPAQCVPLLSLFDPSCTLTIVLIVHAANLELEGPWSFQLRNPKSAALVTHAGVLEFIAEEGVVYLPPWVCLSPRIAPSVSDELG
jgi:hypothetical protein